MRAGRSTGRRKSYGGCYRPANPRLHARARARACAWHLTDSKSDTMRTLFKNAPTTIRANGMYDRMYLTWPRDGTWAGAAPNPKASRAPRFTGATGPRGCGGLHDPAKSSRPCAAGNARALLGAVRAVRCGAVLRVMAVRAGSAHQSKAAHWTVINGVARSVLCNQMAEYSVAIIRRVRTGARVMSVPERVHRMGVSAARART